MRTISTLFALLAAMLLVACNNTTPQTPTASPEAANGNSSPEHEITYAGPPFTFDVEGEASATQFAWSVTVPTGGWSMSFVGVHTDAQTNHAIVRVHLRKPDPQSMVTQALETKRGDYRHGTQAFDTAELVVKLLEHDQNEEEVEYERAAYWSAE